MEQVIYPLSQQGFRSDPIMRALYEGGSKSPEIAMAGPAVVGKVTLELGYNDLHKALRQASAQRTLEPLTSLAFHALPTGVVKRNPLLKQLLAYYQEEVGALRMEAAESMIFAAQPFSDCEWGNLMLSRGKILLRVQGKFRPYSYFRHEGEAPWVSFERLPEIETNDLSKAVEAVHQSNLIESIVRVTSRKPFSIDGTILPFFGHYLTDQ